MKPFRNALLLALLLLVMEVFASAVPVYAETESETETKAYISEILTGHTEAGAGYEFVEIYNSSSESIDLTDWSLQYKSASGSNWINKLVISPYNSNNILEPDNFLLAATEEFLEQSENEDIFTEFEFNSGLRDEGGHLRLIKDDEDTHVVDQIGWGDANNPIGDAIEAPERGQSLSRCFEEEHIVDTGNNAEDFYISDIPKPKQKHICANEKPPDENEDEESEDEEGNEDSEEICENLIISEIMPTEDQGYIELYNADSRKTDLQGCGLEFIINSENNSVTETIWIEDSIEIDSGGYTIIYLEALGVDFLEKSEITIYLLSKQDGQEKELDDTSLINEGRNGQAWAWFDEGWEWTHQPTPGEANIRQPYGSVCEGIVISELLPNPEGPRSQRPREDYAFIELHNPTSEAINLIGCGLQTLSVNSQNYSNIYWFEEDLLLDPGTYLPVYERDSDISLPVGVAGQAFLLSANEDEIDAIGYEPEIPEGASWALLENDWQWTYAKTPGEANQAMPLKPCPEEDQERNPETGRCRSVGSDEPEYEPCGPGRERNPETNRCRQIGANEPNYVPCDPGEERNPETNRCRQIGADEPDYVPCDPGEERNPETNRCRSITTASSSLKPCGPNQERNPETNRCRTVAAPNEGTIAGIQDIETVRQNPIGWWLAGFALLFAAAYGVWEWRYDLANLLYRWRKSSGVD